MNRLPIGHTHSASPNANDFPVLQFPSGLFDRASELSTLTQAVQDFPACAALFLLGPSGIGKSTLLDAMCIEIGKTGRWYARGVFPDQPLPTPYSGFSTALENLARLLLSEPPDRVRQIRQQLSAALGSSGAALTALAPTFEHVIGAQPHTPTQIPDHQTRLLSALRTTCCVLADLGGAPILCIDDIQWADRSSLELLRRMLLELPKPCMFIVATLRNDTTANLTAQVTLAEIRRQRADIAEINLAPLGLSAVTHLLRAAVPDEDVVDIERSAATLHSVSQGNPLLLRQLFYAPDPSVCWLRSEQSQKWIWNPVMLSSLPVSEQLRQLLDLRLRHLDADTIRLLTAAACTAFELDPTFLSELLDIDSAWTVSALRQCEATGLLVSLDGDAPTPHRFQFLHSEVRRLLLDLPSKAQLSALHRQIGEHLLRTTEPGARQTTVFSIASHLTSGLHPERDADHAPEIAAVLVEATRGALRVTAIHTASDYAQNAVQWMAALPDGWDAHYTLMLDVYDVATRTALYTGDYEGVTRCSNAIFQIARTASDKASAYKSCITAATLQGDYDRAVDLLHRAFAEFGVRIPKRPTALHILASYGMARLLLRRRSDTFLRTLSATTDRAWWEVGDIVASAYMAMQWSGQRTLMAYMSLLGVHWSMQHGHTPLSVIAYVMYSALSTNQFGDIAAGRRFAQLAVDLSEHPENHHQRAGVLLTLNALMFHRIQPIGETIDALRRARQWALEDGDVRLAADCTLAFINHAHLAGIPLDVLALDIATMLAELEPYGETVSLMIGRLLHQNVLNLAAESAAPYILTGRICDEEDVLAHLQQSGNRFGLNAFYSMKATAYLLFGKSQEAVAAAEAARAYDDSVGIGLFAEAVRSQIDALARLAWYSQAPASARGQLRRMIGQDIKRLKAWAVASPFNHSHRLHQVEAERARLDGRYAEAERHYAAAWSLAATHGFVHDEAGIAELAARHFFRIEQFESAAEWRSRACDAYARWGSKAKLQYLARTLPMLAGNAGIAPETPSAHDARIMSSVAPEHQGHWLKAATDLQTMSSHADPHQIMRALMSVLVEELAVNRVAFLLHEADQTRLYAELDERASAPTFPSLLLDDETVQQIAPLSVVRLAVQQPTTVCLDPAETALLAARDPYFAARPPMALLCAPLRAHGHTVALLLLERWQAPHQPQKIVFSTSDITYAEVVGTHAALLVENSHLRQRLVVSASSTGDAALSAWLLGAPRIVHRSRDLTPYLQGRLRDLVVLLLLQPADKPIARAEIAAKFWPDTSEGQALTNVRNLLHKLRTAWPEAGDLLDISRQRIHWKPTADRWVDVHAFERGIAEAGRLSGAAAIHLLRSSMELYTSDLLGGAGDEWLLPVQERLHERYLAALGRLVDLLIEGHDYVGALHFAQSLMAAAPLREEPYRQMIRTHALAGDAVAARQVYNDCIAMLAREFDAPPSPATATIYQRFVGE